MKYTGISQERDCVTQAVYFQGSENKIAYFMSSMVVQSFIHSYRSCSSVRFIRISKYICSVVGVMQCDFRPQSFGLRWELI